MKNRKNLVAAGGISLLLVNGLLFKVILDKTIDLKKVPVAAVTIEPRTQINKEMIAYKEIPSIFTDESCAMNEEEILDKITEIEGKIPKGSLFYKQMLFDETELPDYPSLKLKAGQSSFSLGTDLLKSSGNSLTANQKVDLYVTIEPKKEKPVTDLLISSIRILSVKDRKGNLMGSKNSSNVPYVINLAVANEYVELLKIASKVGTIDLYAVADDRESEECVFNEDSKVLDLLVEASDE